MNKELSEFCKRLNLPVHEKFRMEYVIRYEATENLIDSEAFRHVLSNCKITSGKGTNPATKREYMEEHH